MLRTFLFLLCVAPSSVCEIVPLQSLMKDLCKEEASRELFEGTAGAHNQNTSFRWSNYSIPIPAGWTRYAFPPTFSLCGLFNGFVAGVQMNLANLSDADAENEVAQQMKNLGRTYDVVNACVVSLPRRKVLIFAEDQAAADSKTAETIAKGVRVFVDNKITPTPLSCVPLVRNSRMEGTWKWEDSTGNQREIYTFKADGTWEGEISALFSVLGRERRIVEYSGRYTFEGQHITLTGQRKTDAGEIKRLARQGSFDGKKLILSGDEFRRVK